MDKVFKCFLCDFDGKLLSLYVSGLHITIISRIKCKRVINDKKVKSINRILAKFRKEGIFRVARSNFDYTSLVINRRAFELTHSEIIELLDEQGYEN